MYEKIDFLEFDQVCKKIEQRTARSKVLALFSEK